LIFGIGHFKRKPLLLIQGFSSNFLRLELQVVDIVIRGGWFIFSRARRSPAALGFLDLEVYASVVFESNDPYQIPDRPGGASAAADYLAHILGVDFQGKQYSHLVNRAVNDNVIRVIDQ